MKPQSKKSVTALANAIEVATGVVHEIAGKEVAGTLHGERVTRAALATNVASHLQRRLAKHTSTRTK